MIKRGVSKARVSYIVRRATEAAQEGCTDEQIKRVIAQARTERMK